MAKDYKVTYGYGHDDGKSYGTFREALEAAVALKIAQPKWNDVDVINAGNLDVDDASGLSKAEWEAAWAVLEEGESVQQAIEDWIGFRCLTCGQHMDTALGLCHNCTGSKIG